MHELAVTAVGRDRPGIVAAITGELLAVGGNVEDSRMSILGGHFAVMLVVAVPEATGAGELQRRMEDVRERLGLEAVAVSDLDPIAATASRPTHVLSVYGADHPGIVHAITSALAGLGVNITDLGTRLAGSGAAPLYVMMLEVALGEAPESEVRAALEEVGSRAEVEVSLRPLEAEAL